MIYLWHPTPNIIHYSSFIIHQSSVRDAGVLNSKFTAEKLNFSCGKWRFCAVVEDAVFCAEIRYCTGERHRQPITQLVLDSVALSLSAYGSKNVSEIV